MGLPCDAGNSIYRPNMEYMAERAGWERADNICYRIHGALSTSVFDIDWVYASNVPGIKAFLA